MDHKESWVPKNWGFWTVVLEKTLERPLDSKEIQPVHPKGSQSWIFIGKTDAEAQTPILWPPDAQNWLIGKETDAGKDWRWEEKGTKEGEMVGWHQQLDGHEFEQALGVGDGQGSLACCSPWSRKESGTTERLNWLRPWASLCAHCNALAAKRHTYQHHEASHKRQNCGQRPNSSKSPLLPQDSWNNPPTHQPMKLPSL